MEKTLDKKKSKKDPRHPVSSRMRNGKFLLHSHPFLERELGVPEGHIIIDSDVFFTLVNIHGKYVDPNSTIKTEEKNRLT